MAAAEFNALPEYSNPSNPPSAWTEEEDIAMTTIELKAILRPQAPRETFSDSFPDNAIELKAITQPAGPSQTPSGYSTKENIRGSWSPGKGDGPIMSSEEFDALPDWSDVEDDLDWNSAVSQISELNEFVELGEVASGRIW